MKANIVRNRLVPGVNRLSPLCCQGAHLSGIQHFCEFGGQLLLEDLQPLDGVGLAEADLFLKGEKLVPGQIPVWIRGNAQTRVPADSRWCRSRAQGRGSSYPVTR